MKFAISNIAWKEDEEEEISSLMQQLNIKGVEITPWKFISQNDNEEDIINCKQFWNSKGIEIVALQALLFNHPELTIFEDEKSRENTLDYLKKCIDVGAQLGVKSLVFGSPKNRNVPDKAKNDYLEIAMDFFHKIGTYAISKKLFFCIEPNPKEYGTNFICTTQEAIRFVRTLDNEGIRINFDTGSIIMNNEDPNIFNDAFQYIGHIHISEPFLNLIDPTRELYREICNLLRKKNYQGNISIEMKKCSEINNIENIKNVLIGIKKLYNCKKG